MFIFLLSSLTNSLLSKKTVISEAISPTGGPIADVNDAIVMLALVTKKIAILTEKNSRKFVYLLIYLLIFVF